jgi:radical SAM protein with 4Fe4S-binding SPASM domain
MQLLAGLEEPRKVHPDLPVFRMRRGGTIVYYTPGIVVPVHPESDVAVRAALSGTVTSVSGPVARVAEVLIEEARKVVSRWKQFLDREFSPDVLALHLSNHCNLDCTYCYSRANRDIGTPVPLEAVSKAARLVTRECARKGKDAIVVLHGGGEPTVQWDLLLRVVDTVKVETLRAGISCHCQMSTNACFETSKAAWLARNFQLISISCDGSPDLQNGQRPFRNGRDSSATVERNAKALAGEGARIEVRCTITPGSVYRQAEIVAYAHEQLHAQSIRFEPVFQTADWAEGGPEDHASRFVRGFLAAQAEAGRRNCHLACGGVRLDELHGPFCDILRDTLLIGADGTAYACGFRAGDHRAVIGWPGQGVEYELDRGRIEALRKAAARIPDACQACVNVHHCARMCPAFCYMGEGHQQGSDGAFRCRIHSLLTAEWILNAASGLGRNDPSAEPEEADGAVRGDHSIQGHHPSGPFV